MTHLRLRYNEPAERWTDALPLGNGRIGAMHFAGVVSDRFQLNEDSAWSGSPATARGEAALTGADGPADLAEVRAAIDDGDFGQARSSAQRLQRGDTQSYQPVADLRIEAEDEVGAGYSGYSRWLDLATATSGSTWTSPQGTTSQEAFISEPHQVLVIHRHREGAPLRLRLRLVGAHPTRQFHVDGTTATLLQRLPSRVFPSHVDVATPVIYDEGPGACGTVLTKMRVITDGQVQPTDDGLRVLEAQDIVILLAIETDVDTVSPTPVEPHGDVAVLASITTATLDEAERTPLPVLRERHCRAHARLFDRVDLRLNEDSELDTLATDARLERLTDGATDPGLVALAFAYGRYLMIAGSRSGTAPMTLQGIWNDSVRPPWSSAYTININLEMNYWPAASANLAECAQPLFVWLERLAAQGTRTAQELYGLDGWVAHHNSDLWGFSAPAGRGSDEPGWSMWPLGGIWLATHIWDHFRYTGDIGFLTRLWPVLRGAVVFGLGWLVPDGDGGLRTIPSTSPENHYYLPDGSVTALSVSTTSDVVLMRELFGQCLRAIDQLGVVEPDLTQRLRDALDRLPQPRITADKRVSEWVSDPVEYEPTHRHQSHLIGVYPGSLVDVDSDPEMAGAARATLDARGPESTGWSLAWRIGLHARLRDAAAAERLIDRFLTLSPDMEPGVVSVTEGGGVYRSLLCAHPPFQIDGNLGFTAGVIELLMQSHHKEIHLLPALPPSWRAGGVRGLRARGGVTVGLTWINGSLHDAGLVADHDTHIFVRLGDHRVGLDLTAGIAVCVDANLAVTPSSSASPSKEH